MDLLLDACTLIRLVHSEGYSQNLMALENYVQNGNIVLLTHTCVVSEWENHKERNKKRIAKKLAKQFNLPAQTGSGSLPSLVTTEHIDLQYLQIDRLLRGATLLETPEQINYEFAERYRQRLAPFHHKQDSQNDWELFGSAGIYCERNGLHQFYFVSWNDTDFADPNERDRTLHPDLQIRFPKIKIWYFREIEDFLNQLSQLILPDHLLSYNIVRNEKFSYKASVRKHELDSLYHLFHNIYAEVGFVPPHLLRKYHPFTKPTGGYTYYSVFSMNEVRQELVDMFDGVEISSAGIQITKPELFIGVKDVQEKIEYVLLRMSSNLIFQLNGEQGKKSADVRYHNNVVCNCVDCTYHRLEWHKSLKQLSKPQDELEDQLKQAYFYYQFGNYNAAALLLLALRDKAEMQRKYIIYFICLYNLHHLGFFLSNVFYQSSLAPEEIKVLKEIDPVEQCVKLKSRTDYDLLVYIAGGNFFKESFDTIVKHATQIEDNYYSFLRGGWSVNSLAQLLIVEFAELEAVVSRNFIVYDAYSNWDRLFEQVTKGLFASHAMRSSENSALRAFDDYLISALVFYGERKTIYKYFDRYLLKELVYERTNPNIDFLQLALNFFDNENPVREELKAIGDPMTGPFNKRYNKVFKNLMAVAALLQVSAFDVETFGQHLLRFLKNEKMLDRFGWESLRGLINRKGKYFSKRLKDNYLGHFLKTLSRDTIGNLQALLKSYEPGTIKKSQHRQLLSYALDRDLLGRSTERVELLALIAEKSKDDQKQHITAAIKQLLAEQFNFTLFYYAVIFELIPLDHKQFLILFDDIDLDKQQYSLRSMSTGNEERNVARLDQLLNICFKYDINLKLRQIARMKIIGAYYNWLLNMDRYDYSDFSFEWVTRYGTDYYYKAMAKSKKLNAVVVNYLRTNSDPTLERALIKITFYSGK